MLLREHRGRHQHRDLFAAHHRLERRADRDLRLAEADVAADEPVHRPLGLHVGLGVGDRRELIRRFLEQKRALELVLPLVVLRKREALARLALRMHCEQLRSVIEHGALRGLLRPRPARVTQLTQRGRAFPDAHVSRDEKRLLQRHVKFRAAGELQREHLVRFPLRDRKTLQPEILPDPVLEMHDEIALVQLAEIDLRPIRQFPASLERKTAGAGVAVAPEQFRVGQHGHFGRGKGEPAREYAGGKNNVAALGGRNQVAQPLDLALVVAVNENAPLLPAPFAQLLEKALALRFLDDEITRLENAKPMLVERRAEILLRSRGLRALENVNARRGKPVFASIFKSESWK